MRGKPTLTLNQLDSLLRSFFVNVYNERAHSETKTPPAERWEAHGFLPRMPDSLEKLDLLLLTVAQQRKVHPDGIRYQGLRYIDAALAAYIGESVTLRYDPRDMAEILSSRPTHVQGNLPGVGWRDCSAQRNPKRPKSTATRMRENETTLIENRPRNIRSGPH
jgi:hypothetical protein